MNLKHGKKIFTFLLATLLAAPFTGCGGGGGGSTTVGGGGNTTSGGTASYGSLSGTAVKGPVHGGTVTAYAIGNGTMGAKIGQATTDAQGNFTINMGTYTGPVMVEITGGSYTDEATGTTMPMATGDVMAAVIPNLASGATMTGVQLTPLTSIAESMAHNMTGGMTPANIAAANTDVGDYFMVNDILHTQPMNPLQAGSGTVATLDMINYGMSIAAMSQEASGLGMTSSSNMVTAMMNDASDGVMNGMMGSTSVTMGGMMGGSTTMQATAGTSGLANAMTVFAGSARNQSGVTATQMQTLINQLDASNGTIMTTGGTASTQRLSGMAFYGTLTNSKVTAYALNNGAMGAQLASGATDAQGNFTMTIGSYSGPLMLEASGGTYTDLATGTTMTMTAGNVMTAVIPSITAGVDMTGVEITPLTTMAQSRAQQLTGGMTSANISTANQAVGGYFMVSNILTTRPMDPAQGGSGTTATQDMRDYGVSIAAMAQYAQNLGMTDPSEMITAMSSDASDGTLNGMMGSTQITLTGMGSGGMMGSGGTMMSTTAGTSDLATAMSDYMGSAANLSGLTITDMQALMNSLYSSNGTLP